MVQGDMGEKGPCGPWEGDRGRQGHCGQLHVNWLLTNLTDSYEAPSLSQAQCGVVEVQDGFELSGGRRREHESDGSASQESCREVK